MSSDTNVLAAVVGTGMAGGFGLLGWLAKTLFATVRGDIAELNAELKTLVASSGMFDRRLTRLEADRDLESVMARTGRRRRSDERSMEP